MAIRKYIAIFSKEIHFVFVDFAGEMTLFLLILLIVFSNGFSYYIYNLTDMLLVMQAGSVERGIFYACFGRSFFRFRTVEGRARRGVKSDFGQTMGRKSRQKRRTGLWQRTMQLLRKRY